MSKRDIVGVAAAMALGALIGPAGLGIELARSQFTYPTDDGIRAATEYGQQVV